MREKSKNEDGGREEGREEGQIERFPSYIFSLFIYTIKPDIRTRRH